VVKEGGRLRWSGWSRCYIVVFTDRRGDRGAVELIARVLWGMHW